METCYISESFMREYLQDAHPEATIKNAKIEDIDIALFRSFLVLKYHVTYGTGVQGYMSPVLTGNSDKGWSDVGAGNFISNFIRLFGIDEEIELKSLLNKPCRVFSDHNGIYAIANFLEDEDKWFCPEYYYEVLKQKNEKSK